MAEPGADNPGIAVVQLHGVYDTANDIVLMNRIRRGAPGVNVITPLRITGSDSAVLVNRGWVYSPDGAAIDLSFWRVNISDAAPVGSTAPGSVVGLATPMSREDAGGAVVKLIGGATRVQRLSLPAATGALPYPVVPLLVQLIPQDTIVRSGVPVPVPLPELTSGPHLSYAVQWFAFALIAVAGSLLVVFQTRRSGTSRIS
jgi:surfeit locus 1 family protein